MISPPDVPWSRVAGFVRQHTHDLRNELNGLDLEAALLADLVTDPEARESVARLRAEIRHVASSLRGLSGRFADPRPTLLRLPARELVMIWKDQVEQLRAEPALEIAWEEEFAAEELNVDPGLLAGVFLELLTNAATFRPSGPIRAVSTARAGTFTFSQHEPKAAPLEPAHWGREPFLSTRRGGYGLGLFAVRRAVDANGGAVSWTFAPDAGCLVTSLSFPIAA